MRKEIEKVMLRIAKIVEKNRKLYAEAERNYKDTGYDRYWKKMKKLDAEYEEMLQVLYPKEQIEVGCETLKKLDELQQKIKCIKSKWDYLRHELPDTVDTIGIDDIFNDIKNLIN